MSIKHLLPQNGNFYKANLHAHTTVSDGKNTIEEAKELYKSNGYSILAYTDHSVYGNYPELTDESFVALAGLEIDINETGKPWPSTKTYHINLVDTDPTLHADIKKNLELPPQDYYNIDAINEYLAKAKELGFLATYNHPYWSFQSAPDYIVLKNLFAMEIYNHGCELEFANGYAPQPYEEMLRSGQKINCLATDDNHNHYPIDDPNFDSFGGWIMVKADTLNYKSVIESLKAGNFYASTGPEIKELYIEDNVLVVKTSPVERINALHENRTFKINIASKGETVSEARFELTGEEGYVRIECRDQYGRYAFSNAHFI